MSGGSGVGGRPEPALDLGDSWVVTTGRAVCEIILEPGVRKEKKESVGIVRFLRLV